MGWGRMLLLGDLGNQMDIRDQQNKIEDLQNQLYRMRTQSSGSDLSNRVDQLEREVDELRLYLTALIRYLSQNGSINQADFARLVEAIDRSDGTPDSGYRGPVHQ